MVMDENNGHISWVSIGEYTGLEQARTFMASYGHTMPEEARVYLQKLIDIKVIYERLKDEGVPHQEACKKAIAEYNHTKLDK